MNKFFIFLVMLPSALWESLGADIVQLRAILNVRLMIDDRKPSPIGRQSKVKKDRKYGSLINAFLFCVMGFIYMFPIMMVPDRVFSMTLYFGILLLAITLMLITDFSNVLFDSRDKFILFPRPVSDRTMVLARLLHIVIYLFRVVIPLSLPGWILVGYMDGWKSATLFALPMIMMVLIALFIVNGVYLLILRMAKPEKFKDVINYFQILTSIVYFTSMYVCQRVFVQPNLNMWDITRHAWVKYLPPYWLGVCWAWVGYPVALVGTKVLAVLAIIVPLFFIYIIIKYLAPQFAQRMAGIDVTEPTQGGAAKRQSSKVFSNKLAAMMNQTDDAKAGFIISWIQTSRSRSFKMRVFPTFAYVPVYFFFNLTSGRNSLSYSFQHMGEHNNYLVLLYLTSFAMISALTYLTTSEQYKAAWIYYASPLEVPGRIMVGAFKAIWIKYFMPFFIAISIFVIYTWGAKAIWDVVLALVNVTLFVACIARLSFRHLPFSIIEQMKQGGGRIVKSLLSMAIPGLLGVGHYFALDMLWLKLIFLVLSSILLWLVLDSYARTTWANMIKGEDE